MNDWDALEQLIGEIEGSGPGTFLFPSAETGGDAYRRLRERHKRLDEFLDGLCSGCKVTEAQCREVECPTILIRDILEGKPIVEAWREEQPIVEASGD